MANTLKFGAGQWATKEGSTLAYNDENDNYKPLPFTFTRASNATVVNKAGLIETVGSDMPRIDFLGNTQGALKLEPQRTNLITYSSDFPRTYWAKSGASIQGDPSTAGSELVTNGDFATDSDWIKGSGVTISSGKAVFTNVSNATQGLVQGNVAVIGKTYKITFTISDYNQGAVYVLRPTSLGAGSAVSSNGTFTFTIEAQSSLSFILFTVGTTTLSIDNVSVKEVQGFTSPDGTTNAYKLVESATNAVHTISNSNLSITLNEYYTFSCIAKKSERSVIQFVPSTSRFGTTHANFDLENGIVSVESNGVASIKELSDNYYICSFTVQCTSGGSGNINIQIANSTTMGLYASYQGDGTSGIYIYGAQLEQGSYATSYIPTQGGAVTRLAESCSQTVPSGIIGQTEGTILVDVDFKTLIGTNMFVSIRPDASNKIEIYRDGNIIYAETASSNSFNISKTNITVGRYKIAFAYSSGSSAMYINGVLIGSNTATFAFTSTLEEIYINSRGTSFIEQSNYNDLKLYNTRLTNAELQALTT